jgi:flagellar motor switch/type III secretory pathway protein FliN
VPREAAGAMRDARRAVAAAIDTTKIGAVLSEIVGAEAAVRVADVELTTQDAPSFGSTSLMLGTLDDAVRVHLELDTELARAVVARTLGRPVKLAHPQALLGPEVEGALLAIVLEIARRAHGRATPLVPIGHGVWRRDPGDRRLVVRAAVSLAESAYAARVTLDLRKTAPASPRDARALLSSLQRLPITLPLAAAVSLVRASDVFALSAGDIWMPGEGWTARLDRAMGHLVGEAVLAPPAASRGIGVTLGDRGEIVLGAEKTILLDAETAMQSPNQGETATSDVVLDAPLVVRVEVGAVTLSAAEWAELAPGDVVAVGRRLSEPVILRIAGAEVARGELVDIEGELGVRIRERARST